MTSVKLSVNAAARFSCTHTSLFSLLLSLISCPYAFPLKVQPIRERERLIVARDSEQTLCVNIVCSCVAVSIIVVFHLSFNIVASTRGETMLARPEPGHRTVVFFSSLLKFAGISGKERPCSLLNNIVEFYCPFLGNFNA